MTRKSDEDEEFKGERIYETKQGLLRAMAHMTKNYLQIKGIESNLKTVDDAITPIIDIILNDMISGVTNSEGKYQVIPDRRKAIYKAISQATEHDIILIAGKGHETYQQIGHVKHHFDDREVAKEALFMKG